MNGSLEVLYEIIFTIPSNIQISSTSLHSSRMRTARALTVSPSMLCGGGSALGGGVCSWGVPALGGACSWGVCSWGRWYPSMQNPPPIDKITEACKKLPCPNFVAGGN